MTMISGPSPIQPAASVNGQQKIDSTPKHQTETIHTPATETGPQDSRGISTPGKNKADSIAFFAGPDKIIDQTFSLARAKHPIAQADALNDFHQAISDMTPGELDDMKDAIVGRMSSEDSSQWDRNLLQKMYNVADAVSENRKVDLHGGTKIPGGKIPGFPEKPFPCFPPNIIRPTPMPGHPSEKLPDNRFKDMIKLHNESSSLLADSEK